MDIVGTISASIHLAEVIIGQVKKFRDAPKQLQSISETVSFLQRILGQLKGTLNPAPGVGHAAVRLTREGEEIGFHAANKCQRILERILTDVLGAELNVKDGKIILGLRARLTWMVRDGTARELLKELKDAKEDLLLSNSVNQLALAQQSSRVDQEKLDYLTAMAALIFKQRSPDQSPGSAAHGDGPLVNRFSPDAPHQPGPPRATNGGKAGLNSGAPLPPPAALNLSGSGALSPPDIRQGGITRLKRGHIPNDLLFESRRLRWINDPFDHDYINIYVLDDASVLELRDLLTKVERGKLELAERHAKVSEFEWVRKLERSKERDSSPGNHPNELDDGELVDSLIQRWILPSAPAPPSPQLTPTTPGRHVRKSSRSPRRRQCDVMFKTGDVMYKCHTCATGDYQVFCGDCFNPKHHRGHDTESKKSRDPGDYCDCGHKNAVRRQMVCDVHGTMSPDS